MESFQSVSDFVFVCRKVKGNFVCVFEMVARLYSEFQIFYIEKMKESERKCNWIFLVI